VSRRAGLYLRISKDLHEGAGVERQRADGERLIEQRGWALTEVYVDNDISAAGRKRRPDYQRMLHDLESGHIDAVVSRSFERLCKSRREQLTFVELGQEKRAPVAFTHAPDLDLTTAVGRGMADMMAAWARVEMEQKSERHVDQIAQAARQGRMVGGRRAFGYTADGLHLDPVEAPVLADMYDQWLTGTDLSSIARHLNAQGWRTPRGNAWTRGAVREVLANPRNAGLRGMRDVANRKTGTRSQWHRIIGPALWPGVVAEETWRAAMTRIQDPARPGTHKGVYPSKHLLSGIAVCGWEGCARILVAGRRDRQRLLRCPSMRHVTRSAQLIEDYVELVVVEFYRSPEGRTTGPSVGAGGADTAELVSRSALLRARLRESAEMYGAGELSREGHRVAAERIRGELAELDGRIAAVGRVDVTVGMAAAADPEAEWDSYPLGRKREVIRRIMQVRVLPARSGRPGGVRFHPDTVDIDWL
jgi:DNA invertase Pin-like site-specific DNA recombinase